MDFPDENQLEWQPIETCPERITVWIKGNGYIMLAEYNPDIYFPWVSEIHNEISLEWFPEPVEWATWEGEL